MSQCIAMSVTKGSFRDASASFQRSYFDNHERFQYFDCLLPEISGVMWTELNYPAASASGVIAVVLKFWPALIPGGTRCSNTRWNREQWQPPSAGSFRIAPIQSWFKTFQILTLRQICEILPQLGWKLKHATSAEKYKSVTILDSRSVTRLDKTRL